MYSVWSHLFCCVLFLEHTHIYTHAAYMHTVLYRWCIHSEVLFCFSVFYLSCIQSEVIHFASVRFLNTHLLMQHSRMLLPYQPITDSLWHFCQGRQELIPFSVSISNCRGTFCVLKLEEMTCSTGFSSQSKVLDAQSSFPIWPEDGSRGLSGCFAGWPVTPAVWNRPTVTVTCTLSLCEMGWSSGRSELMARAHIKSSSGLLGLF